MKYRLTLRLAREPGGGLPPGGPPRRRALRGRRGGPTLTETLGEALIKSEALVAGSQRSFSPGTRGVGRGELPHGHCSQRAPCGVGVGDGLNTCWRAYG